MEQSTTAIGSTVPVFSGGGGGTPDGSTPAPSSAPFVLTTATGALPNARVLAGEAAVLSVTDGGPGGDVTVGVDALGITTAKLAANAVTNAKLAQVATGTVKGNVSGVLADPSDLTQVQLVSLFTVTTTTDPTLTSDSASGYFAGQRWVNTAADRVWECVSAAVGAAVWRRVGGYGSTFLADAGTVALYTFNGNANDSGGGGLNLTPAGTINYCPGFANRSVFRGVSGTNFSLASATLDLSADLCMEALILPRAGTAYTHTYVQYGPNASRRYYLDFDNTTSAFIESGYWNGATHIEISTGILTDEWSYYCMTRTSSGGNTTLTLYVNGAVAGTRTDAGGPTSGSSTLYVGRNATGTTTQVMNGEYMAGLHLSTTIPSADEVRRRAQLYHPYPGVCA